MVELRRPSFHTVHLSCILVVVLLSWNYFLPLWNDAFTHLSFLDGQVTEAFPPSAFSDIRPVSFRSDVGRKNLDFPDHPIQWRDLDAPPPCRRGWEQQQQRAGEYPGGEQWTRGRADLHVPRPSRKGRCRSYNQGCESAFILCRYGSSSFFRCGSGSSCFLNADPDPA